MAQAQAELTGVFQRLIRRPVAVLMLVAALMVTSVVATLRIPVELIPKGFSADWISVQAPWAGANPGEVEQRVVRPLEEELRTIRGIQEMYAVAAEGYGVVNLGFSGTADMDQAYAEVADRLERVRPRLPREADRVAARRWTTESTPIAWSAILFPPELAEEAPGLIEEVLIPRLEALDGVATVEVHGLEPRSVRVWLDEDRVAANRVDVGDLVRRLQADNLSVPVGDLDDAGSRYIVRVDGRFASLADLEDFPVRPGLRVRDVGRVVAARDEPEELFRIQGGYALAMAIGKENSANTFAVSRQVKRLLEEELPRDPLLGRLRFWVWYNEGEAIGESLRDLVENALIGSLIACAILFLFLRRVRYTLLIALSIPFSVLVTLSWLYFSGASFNLLSMMGITISVGMLVDNSVVIVESIFQRRRDGASRDAACAEGPAEMTLSVVTGTLTTVVVFLPLIFMSEDRNARIMTTSIGVPLCVALLAALLLSIVIVPVAMRTLERDQPAAAGPDLRGRLAAWRLPAALSECLPRLARWSLRHRLVAASLAVLFLASGRYAAAGNQVTAEGSFGGGQIEYDFKLSSNLTLAEAEAALLPIEEALNNPPLAEQIGKPDVGINFSRSGGELYLWHEVAPSPDQRDRIDRLLKEKLPRHPAVELRIEDRWSRMDTSDENWTRVGIEGPDSSMVAQIAERVRELARADPVYASVAPPEDAAREMLVTLDRERLHNAGASSEQVLGLLEWALRGLMISRFETEHGDVPIIIEFDEPEDPDRARLEELVVAGFEKGGLPLSTFASISHARGPGAIVRRDGRTVEVVGLKTQDKDLKKNAAELRALMAKVEMPEGYRWQQSGGWEEFQEDMAELQSAMYLAVALVFLLMGLLFESLILPFSVLSTIAFAVVGAYWSFKLSGTPVDLMGMIGMIVLAGVAVNNGIVLVDCILRLQAAGMARAQAIEQAVRERLRPVLMTATTTVAGLLPTALATPDGSGVSFQSLAVGVAGGLAFTTFFTLWMVPLLYSLLQDLGEVLRREIWVRLAGRG